MKLSLMAAISENGIIGSDLDIPWKARGEQLLFKALTYNQWLMVGRKTFNSMGKLPNRKYAVISRSSIESPDPDVQYFKSVELALEKLKQITDHVIISGGGQIYRELITKVDTLHLSVIHKNVHGNIKFPPLPELFKKVFEQQFVSNINYTYQIWQKG